MRNSVSVFLAVMVGLALVRTLDAFTPAETNRVVGIALGRVIMSSSDDCLDGEEHEYVPEDDVHTWQGFFHFDMPGWSFDDKKAAFDWYLSSLGTTDLKNLSDGREKLKVRMALGQCSMLGYTNSVQPLKALALNPRGIYRDKAIELVMKYSPVDNTTTDFVETIVTNTIGYTIRERGKACGMYARNLMTRTFTTSDQIAARDRAVRMLYRHRYLDLVGTTILDNLFLSYYAGYGLSSNRLAFANYVLAHPDCDEYDRRDFIPITNQLISVGQPLQQLNLEGN